jgi:hypothetical protein
MISLAVVTGLTAGLVVLAASYMAFRYGLKCGQLLSHIPPVIDSKPDDRVDTTKHNIYD